MPSQLTLTKLPKARKSQSCARCATETSVAPFDFSGKPTNQNSCAVPMILPGAQSAWQVRVETLPSRPVFSDPFKQNSSLAGRGHRSRLGHLTLACDGWTDLSA